MGIHPVWYKLPTAYNSAIGRMVSRFAVLETALRMLIYALLDVNPKLGRVAVRSPRVRDSFTMIEDLMALRDFKTTLNIKLMATKAAELEEFRDKIAHGVWVKHPGSGKPILQVTTGKYPHRKGGKSMKARINPIAASIPLDVFRTYTNAVGPLLKAVKQLGRELQPQHDALLKRSREQSEKD